MREGSLDSPTRHAIDWQNPRFLDPENLDAEMRRQFDVCHTCRRCFNLCDSFPRLFDLIDEHEDELLGVDSTGFKGVVDACTLCDMCFLTKCPYVPPHDFNIDFPHLMLRYRAFEKKNAGIPFFDKQLTETDRNGKVASAFAGLANWCSNTSNALARRLLQAVAGVHKDVELPKFHRRTLVARAKTENQVVNAAAPANGRKIALFATCFANYNNPDIGTAALNVLTHNGVEAEVVYPGCCGMPQLEQGDIGEVAKKAKSTAIALKPYLDKGISVVSLTPSCSLMMKFEWPLILPDDKDIARLAQSSFDISEYVVDIIKKEGLVEGLEPISEHVALHLACHARAQNMGNKAADMLHAIPHTKVTVVERCSGHGGSWGIKKKNFEVATKFAGQTVRKTAEAKPTHVCSECPLAGKHISQGLEGLGNNAPNVEQSSHPIQLLAKAYGF